jgi:hypothetical protein
MSERIPPIRKCGTMEVHQRLLEQNPTFRRNLLEFESIVARRASSGIAARATIATIKVVVHVVYNTPVEQISTAQVSSEIDALNRDYSAGNADKSKIPAVWAGLSIDTNIRFALATIDPNGQPTNGITYTQTAQTSFSQDDSVKSSATGGIDPWPTDKYLNIWVCTLGNGLLGYAQFPGGPAATDGVVILNQAFGTVGTSTAPFNLGRTGTHEIGHYLNLHHIWGDTSHCEGTDFVDDTPNAQLPNYGKPVFPHITCSNGPSGDMFMNYMDYVDDDTMVLFTPGQSSRMNAALDGPRNSLLT